MDLSTDIRQDNTATFHINRDYYTQHLSEVDNSQHISISSKATRFLRNVGHHLKKAYCADNLTQSHNLRKSHPSAATFSVDESSSVLSNDSDSRGYSQNGFQTRSTCCRPSLLTSFLLHLFPFIRILRDYNLKRSLPNDIIAGFTVGIMNIPQGMAYAMLATLPPVCGLYCALFSPVVYFFFGTSRHLAVGTYSIVSLLVGASLDRSFSKIFPPQDPSTTIAPPANSTSPDISDPLAAKRVLLATSICMVVGLIQLLMGVCRLGFITRFLSDPMISGFTVGSAIHTVASQLGTMLGLNLPKHTGLFNVPLKLYEVCKNLPKTNLVSLGMSSFSMVVLFIFKRWINPPISKKIKVPIPAELLIIIFGAITTKFMQLDKNYDLRVVGHVPSGLPVPSVPDVSLVSSLIPEVIVISLIAFSISFSLSSVYAKQEGYNVDSNQELVAYGFTNLTGSFFSMFPVAGSISRTAVQVNMQGQSQIAGLFTSLVVLFVVLFAGPLFCTVPMCCLSAIILTALQSMFLQIFGLPRLWRFSVWDFLSWIVTFTATAMLDVIYGIIVGIMFSALTIILRAQGAKASVMGQFADTEVFQPTSCYANCKEINQVKIVRYEGSIFYACADNFYASVVEATELDPRLIKYRKRRIVRAIALVNSRLEPESKEDVDSFIELEFQSGAPSAEITQNSEIIHAIFNGDRKSGEPTPIELLASHNISTSEKTKAHLRWLNEKALKSKSRHSVKCSSLFSFIPCKQMNQREREILMLKRTHKLSKLDDLVSSIPFKYLVLDCSAWNMIDMVGIQTLQLLISDYNDIGITVCLANAAKPLQTSLAAKEFSNVLDSSLLFISVHDALLWIQSVDMSTPSIARSARSALNMHPVPSGITMDTMLDDPSNY